MAYRIRLVSLECVAPQEIDGDETYISVNDAKIWQAHPDKMTHVLSHANHINQVDFAAGRKYTGAGWVALNNFQPESGVVPGLSGTTMLQLWDADSLTADDLLGETPIDASQVSGGNISVVFQRSGANYRLTYKVEAE